MLDIEWIRGALFVGFLWLVFSSAFWFLLVTLLERFRSPRGTTVARRHPWRWISWACAFMGLCCFLYGSYVEPYWPEITHVRISSPKMAKDAPPLRLVLLSDLHS